MSQIDKKIRFIRAWYNNECKKLSFGDKLKLARIWIEICLSDEEYEMAAAIKDEREKVVKRHVKEKRRKRKLSQKIIVWMYLAKRKIRAIYLKSRYL